MYKLHTADNKAEKELRRYIEIRNDIRRKLDELKIEPRRANGAHPLHGKLFGKWGCWLGYNIRMIYTIDDENKIIYVHAVGTHKIY
jgi:addiction module RelE/StbE family toxin